LTTESIFSEPAPQIKALVRNLSAFTTLFAPGKSWDNARSTATPYTESRLTRSVANERVGFPVVEQSRNSVPWNKNRSKLRKSVPNSSTEEKTTRNSVPWNKNKKQTLGNTFQTIPQKRKQPKIPFRGTKIEANPLNAVPNHSAEQTTTQK
jgi:hypothetical protein